MRYVVLIRYGFGRFHVVLVVSRTKESISCAETLQGHGMTWWSDGRFLLTTGGAGRPGQRTTFAALKEPVVAYSIPGFRLLDERLPSYTRDAFEGATVQISGEAVLEEPHRLALQLVLVPPRQEPVHRETIGDRCIEDGDPATWIVLARHGDESADRLAVRRVGRWPPPLRATMRP